MRQALLIATVVVISSVPAWAQRSNPYAKLFDTRQALQQALQDKSASLTPAPKRRVVCGMTVIEVGPEVDPKMAITPPKDPKTRYTMRGVEPPICK